MTLMGQVSDLGPSWPSCFVCIALLFILLKNIKLLTFNILSRVPGAYLLDIKWNGKPLKCCPFKIDVKNPVYPEKVGVTGDIKTGVLGKDIDLKIDPREAGHGK
jgi:hypothetical protein